MKKPTTKCLKIFKTCNLYLCFLGLGMCASVPGPCLLDLRDLINTDTQHIAFIYTAKSIGYLVGSIIGGAILDAMKYKQAILTFANFIMAGSLLGVPWSKGLGTLTGYLVVNSMAMGVIDTGGNILCLTLWGSESGPYYQALHFTFGLGGLLGPLVAAPFLGNHGSEDLLDNTKNVTYSVNSTSSFNFTSSFLDTDNITTHQTIPDIAYPFTIIGVYQMFVTAIFLVASIISPTEVKSQQIEEDQNSQNKLGFVVIVVFLNVLLLFVETGTEIGYAQMLTTYVVKGRLKLTSSTGSYMTSTFWASFTIARLASVFLAIKLSNFKMIIGDLIVTSIGAAILLLLASHEWAIWLASVLLGAGIASFFPSAVGWMNIYITVTNKIAAIFTIGAVFGEMVIPFTITYFIETVPDALIYVVVSSCIFASLIVLFLYLILRKRPKRMLKEPQIAEKPGPSCFVVSGTGTEEMVT